MKNKPQGVFYSAHLLVDHTFGRPRHETDGRTDGRTHPWIGDHGDDGDDDGDDDDDDDENDDAVDARETSRETRTDGDDRHGTEKQDDDIKNWRNVDDDSSVVG